jgi:hypothetical protein
MDIHKPKPIHNWREFLKEVGIIVLGVAIALTAEQAVQWLHWQGEVNIARQAIFAEVRANNTTFSARRIAYAPCLERQAFEAGRILDDLQAGRSPGSFTVFHVGAHTVLNENDWQSERSAQSLTHFPRAELAQLSSHYAILPLFRGWLDQEADAWQALSVLRHAPKEIPIGDVLRLRKALATVQWTENLLVLNAGRQLRLNRQLGIADPPDQRERAKRFCALDEEAWMQSIRSTEQRQ